MVLSDTALLNKWEQRHADAEGHGQTAQVLLRNLHLLPAQGTALDLACGRGANALLLAGQGLDVTAWDFSTTAINRLITAAASESLSLTTEVRDVTVFPPRAASFDVVLVSYFLEHSLLQTIKEAVRPGGLLIYETFAQTAVSERGPGNSDWRLYDNELIDLCSDMTIHYYREEGRRGDLSSGWRDVAMIVASKKT